MKKYLNFLRQNGLYLAAVITVLATALINFNVRPYGDDFFYSRFTKGDPDFFIARHVEHYFRANGRIMVHLLVSLFLSWDIHIWQIVNSFMLGGIVLFGTKTLMSKININSQLDYSNWSALIFAVSIAFLGIGITRQSVYWLTGSFNYTYPILMLLIYWYLLSRKVYAGKIALAIPFMAFLSAATVEQVSLMSFGLTLLVILERRKMLKQKSDRVLISALVASAIGMLTVVMSPSVFLRASIEDAPVTGFLTLLKYNIKNQGNTIIFSKEMMPYILMAIMAASGTIWLFRDKNLTKRRILDKGIIFYGSSAALSWLWKMTLHVIAKDSRYMSILFLLFIGTGIVLLLFYAALLVYNNKAISNSALPFIAVVLCIGSQVMMLVSPVYGMRNLLTAVVMLVLYTAALMPHLNKIGIPVVTSAVISYLFNIPWLIPLIIFAVMLMLPDSKNTHKNNLRIKTASAIGYISIALTAAIAMNGSISGYRTNAQVYDSNIQTVEKYKLDNEAGRLIQTKLPDDLYAWVMPYHNPYYVPYYNLFIGIGQNSEIDWQ